MKRKSYFNIPKRTKKETRLLRRKRKSQMLTFGDTADGRTFMSIMGLLCRDNYAKKVVKKVGDIFSSLCKTLNTFRGMSMYEGTFAISSCWRETLLSVERSTVLKSSGMKELVIDMCKAQARKKLTEEEQKQFDFLAL